ncbi:cytochrome P450 [Mariannaea sp. PMI_226]|nr:cytochrome P450 [Mariannaea sp. PMI_226]
MAFPSLDIFSPALSPLSIGLIALATVVCLIVIERFLEVPYPPDICIVGQSEGSRRLSLRTRLRYYTNCERLYHDAYVNYVKKNKPVVIPGFGLRKEVILPQSLMKWVLSQPDHLLSTHLAFAEIDQAKWSLGHDKFVADPWQALLVKTEMNIVLETICASLNNELSVVFDEHFGTDVSNWKEIDLIGAVKLIVAQSSSRFTVGLPLCRNKDYLQTAMNINDRLIINAGVTGGSPRILRPLVGYLLNVKTRRLLSKMKKWFDPLWTERLKLLQFDPDDPSHQEPRDQLQLTMRYAQKLRQEELYDYDSILRRLAASNFGSMPQTQTQVTNLILNILGSDAEFNTINILRDEIDRILGQSDKGFLWTKAKISQMVRADSVARETLRLQSFGGRAIFRKVMTSNFNTPEGYHIPEGTIISFLSQPAHVDGDRMDDATTFDPFRFSRQRELAKRNKEKTPPVSMVSTAPEFLPFGHGKNACPGRFLVDFELKMIIAYVLRNYDLAFPAGYKGKRPSNIWLMEAVVPPPGVKIMVKRRTVD